MTQDEQDFQGIRNLFREESAAIVTMAAGQIARVAHLENQIVELQNMSFLPSSEGEGELAQIKYRLQIGLKPDGSPDYVWVTGMNKQAFFDNLVLAYIKYNLIKRLGVSEISSSPLAVQQDTEPIAQVQRQEERPATPENRIYHTFKTYAGDWFSMRRDTLRPNSIKSYDSLLHKHFIPYFGDVLLSEITWSSVQRYLNERREMGKETLRSHLAKLKAIFESAMEDGLLAINPVKNRNIRNPGKALPRREALTEEEREKIAKVLPTMEEKDAMYVAICMYAGTRKSETLGLQVKHIQGNQIQVRQQCQVNNKSIILPPKSECGVRDIDIQNRLQPYLAHRGDKEDFIFGKGTKPPTKYMFEKMCKRIEACLQGTSISSHVLRHTFITECAENDVPVNVTQEMVGHSTPAMTLGTYTTVTEKMKQNAMQKLNSL